jgi:hypothetical protein
MDAAGKKVGLKGRLWAPLHQPGRLRALVTLVSLALGYAGVYLPFDGEISATTGELAASRKRLALVHDIEQLRTECAKFQHRLTGTSDPTKCVAYVLDGTKQFSLRPIVHEPPEARELGPYKLLALRLQLEGTFHNLTAFVRWLETNERLFRVEDVHIHPDRAGRGALLMELTVLGVIG